MVDARRIGFVTPLPPAPTGIAGYSRDLLDAIDGQWPLDLIVEDNTSGFLASGLLSRRAERQRPDGAAILQLGNSSFHRRAYEFAQQPGHVVVLHDVVLHHGRLGEYVRRNRTRQYRAQMADLYGAEGERIAAAALRGSLSGDLADAPLFEDIVRRARLTVVHSDYARQRVLDRLPDADVRRVPMGVPLPALTFAEDARRALGLPQSAFIIASVTHVNPYKRIPVVLRALRRLVRHIPEALLVIAGSVAPGINLEREIQMLGLKRNVLILGYVTDTQARLLARAADVAVNLRYPSAGETSASLLRLLGAGLPVIVTDDLPSLEFPRSAVLPVPVDRFEDEFLAELLLMLACDTPQRESAGRAARDFVEREHSMSHAVAGYADVIKDAFGVALAPVTPPNLTEASVVVDTQSGANVAELTPTTRTTGDAAWNLSLLGHDATMLALATALGGLRLDQFLPENGVPMNSGTSTIRPELLAVLACPVCKASVELVENKLVCTKCKRRYRIDDGIPVMLADEAE